ncbi:transposase [Streptomyces sp. 35G-GA-8]|uniref:transposase n=1 Tax=Streptomyces sp. 35G-GA-8 TaxID=2939434 RepID=UPI0035B01F93
MRDDPDTRGRDGLFEIEPGLMLRLLIYGYTTGVRSSRAIERKCTDDVAFRLLAADHAPEYRSIARFPRRHLDAIVDLFTQSLHLVTKLGMVTMGRVALDGTKREANASKRKAMSYGRLAHKEGWVEAEIALLEAQAHALLADAEDVDLPAELDRRDKRLANCRQPARRSRPKPPNGHAAMPRRRDAAARGWPPPATSRPSPTPDSRPPPRRAPRPRRRPTSPTPSRGS